MIEDWAARAQLRWPNVPAVYGWLGLDRRGRWLIRGEPITRPQIIETINRNYASDDHGRWYFQNGPQRGYVSLAYTPLVVRVDDDLSGLRAHTGARIATLNAAFLDQQGSLVLDTDIGPGLLLDSDLSWALDRLFDGTGPISSDTLAEMLRLPSGTPTNATLRWQGRAVSVHRVDAEAMPRSLGYCREPVPVAAAAPRVN